MQEPEYEVTHLIGDTSCMVTRENRERCSTPGDYHLLVDISNQGGTVASMCAACFEEVKKLATAEPYVHPIGPDCGMPGTHWSMTGCYIP